MRRAAVLTTLAAALVVPAAAHSVERVEFPDPPPGAPPPAVAPEPTQTQMTLRLERVGGGRAVALVGSRVRVRGSVGVYAAGETVTVRFYSSGRKLGARRVVLQPGADGGGAFRFSYRPPRPGALSVSAAHEPTPALGELSARAAPMDVLPRRITPRSGRASVRALQRRLGRLGYVVGAPGNYDARTARAVIAFRKVTGLRRTATASEDVMRALARGAGRFRVRHPGHGRHIEADLSRQVIALIEGRRVRRIYPMSSGAPSTPTVLGSFRVYLKTAGTNVKGMVHSSYFRGGYATHGFESVPVFPASHGCLRVPIPEALSLFRWIRIGTRVDVYR